MAKHQPDRSLDDVVEGLRAGFNPPMSPQAAREKARIVAEAVKLRAEIQQIFTDVAAWNEYARKPYEAPLDADPDGNLAKILGALDALLQREIQ